MAKLPSMYIKPDTAFIRGMEVGQSGYTVPWAMGIDKDGECFLRGSYTCSDDTGGTCCLYVERRKDGYYVDPSTTRHDVWGRGSANAETDIPVVGFVTR
jgi:hypothetical protein